MIRAIIFQILKIKGVGCSLVQFCELNQHYFWATKIQHLIKHMQKKFLKNTWSFK